MSQEKIVNQFWLPPGASSNGSITREQSINQRQARFHLSLICIAIVSLANCKTYQPVQFFPAQFSTASFDCKQEDSPLSLRAYEYQGHVITTIDYVCRARSPGRWFREHDASIVFDAPDSFLEEITYSFRGWEKVGRCGISFMSKMDIPGDEEDYSGVGPPTTLTNHRVGQAEARAFLVELARKSDFCREGIPHP